MWITTNAGQKDVGRAPSWMLDASITSEGNCEGPQVLDGQFEFSEESLEQLRQRPDFLSVSVSRTKVHGAEILNPRERVWEPMAVHRFREMTVLTSPRGDWWSETFNTARFRMRVGRVRSAGYGACYLSSPAVTEFQGVDSAWSEANGEGGVFLSLRKRFPEVDYAPLTDAVFRMRIKGHPPDRSSIDGGAFVAGSRAVVTCETNIDSNAAIHRGSDYSVGMHYMRQSNCSSVQVFRDVNSAGDLNRRVFLGGLILSIAAALLLEALVTASTRVRNPSE